MVTYRPLEWSDVDAVVEAFDRTWGRPDMADDPALSMELSRHFTMHYLEPAARADVAVDDDGRFLGISASRVEGQPTPFAERARAELAAADARLEDGGLGERVLTDTRGLHRVEVELEDSIGLNDRIHAEVELFLVSPDARGKGVGGTLWHRQMAWFTQLGVPGYYLHTDTGCDVSFYDYHGLKRVAELEASQCPGLDEDIFIYEGVPEANDTPHAEHHG